MRRFLNRIILCLIPVVLSIAVVVWAYIQFQNGRGGFRLGVDLAGGTILVYEVDGSKIPADFKADELAAALKKRIDPADLYNITIRPVPTQPPRVEIILPTGGIHQAEAEQRNWQQLLDKLAYDYNLYDPESGEDNPLSRVPPGEIGALTDRLEELAREDAAKNKTQAPSREEISAHVQGVVRPGGGGRRTLTTDK